MAFEGDLTNLGLADIFQTLGMNRQSGTLVVVHRETERRFYFSDDGVSLLTTRSARKFRLGNLLVGMGRLSEADLKVAVLKQERVKDTKLGDLLLQTGLVKTEDISEACRYQAAEEIYDSFNWQAGKFQFLEGANAGPAGGPGPFAEFYFSVTDIVMEAARRSDEFAMNMETVGDPKEVYIRKGEEPPVDTTDGESPPEGALDRTALLLFRMLDGTMDVSQVFEEFFLSPFDTAAAFVVLIKRGLVATMDAASLQAAAAPFLEAKDFPRAARLLGRAAILAPKNTELLAAYAGAQSAAGERKEASRTYMTLGSEYKAQEQRTEAVEALRKAVEHDSRSQEAYVLLMEVYASLDQFGKAEEACREAGRLLAEERDFKGSIALLDRGLGLVPGSNGLRLQRGNCLIAMGMKEDGLKEMLAVAEDLVEAKADRREILGVYRKLAQLEPENREYKSKVEDLVAGEKAIERRKKVLRVAAVVGVLALAAGAWMLVKTTAQRIEEAAVVIQGPAGLSGPASDEAERFLLRILETESRESNEWTRADALLRDLNNRRNAPEREKRIKSLEERLVQTIILPASELVEAGDYPGGARKILDILPEITDQSLEDIKGPDLDRMWERIQKQYMEVLTVPAEALREQGTLVRDAMATVGGADIAKVDVDRLREILSSAEAALVGREKSDWKAVLEALRQASDQKLMGAEDLRLPELYLTLDQMNAAYGALDDLRYRARAEAFQSELRTLYSTTLSAVTEAKNGGQLDHGVEACTTFLVKCAELKAQEPRKYFAPVIKRLLEGLNLETEVSAMRTTLQGIIENIRLAKLEEERGNFQASFDILKKTISGAQDISFRGIAYLPLRVVTRPAGATLDLKADLGAGLGETITTLKTPCTVRYPYQGRSTLELSHPGFDMMVVERTGIHGDTEAVLELDLQRTLLWTSSLGAAIEGRPALRDGLVFVGTRGGLFSAIKVSSGDLDFQIDTGNLSGISGGILLIGDRAYFGGNDGEAFAVDLSKKAVAWKTPIGTSLEKAPVSSGSLVVFGDSDGKVHALATDGGGEKWATDLGAPVSGRLLAVGDLVLVPLADQRLVALSGADGTEKWTSRLKGPVFGTMAADGRGGVVAGTESSTLEKVLLADGGTAWSVEVDSPCNARPLFRGDSVFAVSSRGTVFEVLAADGAVKERTSIGSNVEGGIHVRGDTLYISGAAGRLIAFDLAGGGVLWTRSGLGRLRTESVSNESVLVTVSADNTGLMVGLKP